MMMMMMMMLLLLSLVLSIGARTMVQAWTLPATTTTPPDGYTSTGHITRRGFVVRTITTTTTTTATTAVATIFGSSTVWWWRRAEDAAVAQEITTAQKIAPVHGVQVATKWNVSDEELLQIVQSDLLERQFLVTGNITQSIYLPTATFTDEIDTYTMDQWMKGTQQLFVGDQSHVRLIDDTLTITPQQIEFRFDEDLMFNLLPIFRPVVSLSGKVILTRDIPTGLITSYREFWDQDILTVLKSAKI
jgi:hypothetical protein